MFVQLIETGSFTLPAKKKINWCYYEYKASKDFWANIRINDKGFDSPFLFIITDEIDDKNQAPNNLPPNYKGWYNQIRATKHFHFSYKREVHELRDIVSALSKAILDSKREIEKKILQN